ncbi:MAG: hypothetical protein J6V88_00405, partial [Kiritimatiellae bacterium]|nr:hypothetical protein [Kiritimatiellia bacterium]
MKTILITTLLLLSSFSWAEHEYDFRKRLEIVHHKGMRDSAQTCKPNEEEIKDGFTIAILKDSSDFIYQTARDFEDYLSVSMNVEAKIRKFDWLPVGAENTITLGIEKDYAANDRIEKLKENTCRILTGDGTFSIVGSDERQVAQGVYHLENLMNLRMGPFIKKGSVTRHEKMNVRMTHSGYGNDIFPDEHLIQMAHYGMTAILVFLDDIDKTKAQEYQDLKALIRRAKKYGLDTYLYSYITAFAHPEDEGGLEKINNAYGRIAGHYPEAKGIILVGESCQFPSKDPRVQAKTWSTRDPNDKRPLAGWFPCSDYPLWLNAVKNAISAKAPNQELVFWTYNWGWAPREDRLKLIDALPKDVTLMATFEMFERRIKRNGIDTPTADYTISFAGPGKYFVSEAERAKERGLKLYTQANASGLTWDFGVVPFQAVPFQWNKRWKALSSANEKWGLTGIMENHHFGWWPSFIAELEKEAYIEGGIPFDDHVKMIASRDYGEENVDEVIEIWKSWSEAAEDYVPTDCNQYGTFRIGPAYPFTFGKETATKAEFPAKRYASNSIGICRLDYLKEGYVPQLTPERMDNEYFEKEIELLIPAAKKYEDGREKFLKMAKTLKGRQAKAAEEMANLAGYFSACYKTAINVKRGAIACRNGNEKELLNAARAEYKNAKEALKYVEYDSRLGWEASMEYTGGVEQ